LIFNQCFNKDIPTDWSCDTDPPPPADEHSWAVQKLVLRATVAPSFTRKPACISNTVRITLDFVNATLPRCARTDLKELCFRHRDTSNPHVMENRRPGALRQLRRLGRMNVCPNYTISYSVESGGNTATNYSSLLRRNKHIERTLYIYYNVIIIYHI